MGACLTLQPLAQYPPLSVAMQDLMGYLTL